MPTLAELLQSALTTPSPGMQTGEELLGTLATLGGAYLNARNMHGRSPIGDPLQIGGQSLLGLGVQGGANRNEEQRQQDLMKMIQAAVPSAMGQAGPDEPKGELLGSLVGKGEPAKDALSITDALYPKAAKAPATPFEAWRAQNPNAPLSDWYKISRPPEKPTETDAQKLDLYKKERAIAQQYKTPPKTPDQLAQDAEARTTGTFNALSKLPITRWNPRVTALSADGSSSSCREQRKRTSTTVRHCPS